jgi:HTH-type transcriptional regulator / antitoxin HigA
MSDVERVEQAWTSIADVLIVPHSEADYAALVTVLDELLDTVGEDESHPLASLMEVIGILIEKYENENIPEIC